MIRGARSNPAFEEDPLVARIGDLTTKYGGEKENRNYVMLKECVDAYVSQGKEVYGIQLYQNYAYMMMRETVSFQERNGFDLSKWQLEFVELCERHLQDGRVAVA